MPQLLYKKVHHELKQRMANGVYPCDTALPSESNLQAEFGVSLITVRRALQELALDGLIERQQGRGNFVRSAASEVAVIGLNNFTSQVASGRLRLVRTLMLDELIAAPAAVSERLHVRSESLLRHLVRLDTQGGVPLSVDEAFMPPAFATGINTEIASSPLFMHLWQKKSGMDLVRTEYAISVESANKRDRELLQLNAKGTVLVTGELVFDSTQRPVLWIVTRYRADRARLCGSVQLVQRKTKHGVIGE